MELNAIVISEDHYNALGVIKSLGEIGVYSSLVLTNVGKTFVDKSKYVSKVVKVNKKEDDIINAIYLLIKESSINVLFPLSDYSAILLDRIRDMFPSHVIIPNMMGKMSYYSNKYEMKKIAEACGLNVPRGKEIILNEKAIWNIYPAIVKPLASIDGQKGDIKIVNSSQELDIIISEYKSKGYSTALIEEFIRGKDQHMVEVMGSVATGGKVRFAGIISKEREFPIQNGSTAYAKVVKCHPGIDYKSIAKIFKLTHYVGLFDIEFKYADGKVYFIECNFRNGAPSYIFTIKGKNIPKHWLESMLNMHFIDEKKHKKTRKMFMVEQNDILNMLKGEVSCMKWISQYITADKIFSSGRDIKPVLSYYAGFLSLLLNRKKKLGR